MNRIVIIQLIIILCFFVSCKTMESFKTDKTDNDLYIYIHSDMDTKLIEEFISEKNEYRIFNDRIYCDSLMSKTILQRYLIFNDWFYSTTSYYYIDVYFKANEEYYLIPDYYTNNLYSGFYGESEYYLPKGIYRIVIDTVLEELKETIWDSKYINKENFTNQGNLVFWLKNSIVYENKKNALDLATVLTYFDSDGWIRDRTSTIFKDLDINFATLVAFLIDNGYFVHNDCESGFTIISLH